MQSASYTISRNGQIVIDALGKAQTPATCNTSNGTISGIKVTGATSYQWVDDKGKVISTELNLVGAAAGNYHLIALNAICIKESDIYTIASKTNNSNYNLAAPVIVQASCGAGNGSVILNFNPGSDYPMVYRWEDDNGLTIGGNTAYLNNIPAGTYKLYGSDVTYCEKYVTSYTITAIPAINVVSQAVVTDDACGFKAGSIKGMVVTGGLPPYHYTWTNLTTGKVAGNAVELNLLAAGDYQLLVTDQTSCNVYTSTYTVNNNKSFIAAPVADNMQICGPGYALLKVNNTATGYSYRLYDDITSALPADEQSNGRFAVNVKANRSFYISQVNGTCESTRTEVKVMVGLSDLNIANTFSPNGDGINDFWQLKGIENYPGAVVQIYNRYGEKVFEAKGYNTPFDGTSNGKQLPVGTYYYIINLSTACNVLSGSITLIR